MLISPRQRTPLLLCLLGCLSGLTATAATVQFLGTPPPTSKFSAQENVPSGTMGITIVRTGDSSNAASVVLDTTDGTATSPTDYTAITSQTVSFDPNETSKTIQVSIVDRGLDFQGDRQFTATLSGVTGDTLGPRGSAQCTIRDVAATISAAVSSMDVLQGTPTITIQLERAAGSGTGALLVALGTINGTAVAGTDFVAPTGTTVAFAANQTTASGTITLIPSLGASTHRSFTVTLGPSGSPAAFIGSPSLVAVRILAVDSTPPVVTITAPGSSIPPSTDFITPVTITGTAIDDKGVVSTLEVWLNGVLLPGVTFASGAFSVTADPVGGTNVIEVRASNPNGLISPILRKTFTWVFKKSLVGVVAPSSLHGTVTGVMKGSVYQVGKTYTVSASAKPGYIFDHWSAPGLSAPGTQFATMKFVYTNTLAISRLIPQITAHFVPNPFVTARVGTFNGLVVEDGTHQKSNATNGLITLSVTTKGTFTGSLKIDGTSYKISGPFDNTGVAKFGPTRSPTLLIPRRNKPSYELALSIDLTGATDQITGTLQEHFRSDLVFNSTLVADRAVNTVPISYLNKIKSGFYTVAFPASPTQTGPTADEYPQGDGIGTIALTQLGKVTLVGTLADGTKITASAPLSADLTAPLYAQLYTLKGGSLGGLITLDDSLPDSDLAGDFQWFRPWQNVHHYQWGWPEGIDVSLVGAKYAVPVGASVLPLLPGTNPNATVTLTDGLLTTPIAKDVNISPTNVFSATDTTVKLKITAATGLVTGDFAHEDNTRPKFTAIILQKGANRAAFGHFLTTKPKVSTGLGQAGAVTVEHN